VEGGGPVSLLFSSCRVSASTNCYLFFTMREYVFIGHEIIGLMGRWVLSYSMGSNGEHNGRLLGYVFIM
jgi:hypothetical protein